MTVSSKAESILAQITPQTKLGDIRQLAKQIKKDHELAMQLWSTERFLPRQLAILIMDSKRLSQELICKLGEDMSAHGTDERNQLIDWLMANQLLKDKKTIALVEGWENNPSALLRRVFWYYQARLRWMGQKATANTAELLTKIEANIAREEPEVQWAMNFTAGWIGIYEIQYRDRCIALGENTGLYKGEKVSKGCTPNYLPAFIAIESGKRNL